jgi:II/X family phage/plasmid replication protein
VIATCEAVASALGLDVAPETRSEWLQGFIRLSRVDITDSFHLANRAQVLAWLRAAEQSAHLSHRGRGQLVKGTTLYFGKNSRRWSLKLYAKGQEIEAKGHKQEAIQDLSSALEWADRTLRAELVMRAMELKRLKLDWLFAWLPVDGVPFGVTPELLRDRLGDMTMTTTAQLSVEVLATFRPALRTAFAAWEAGNDLREILKRPTFYKFRKELLVHGIDIATSVPKEVSNVVPLYRVLEAKPAQIPAWAHGTPLYYEPRHVA